MSSFARDAFDGFLPSVDRDAALKFALTRVFTDGLLEYMIRLLDPQDAVGEIGGDPGWEIEQRTADAPDRTAYATWPPQASFRVFVDPEGFALAHPEAFCSADEFATYVRRAAAMRARQRPDELPLITRILDLLPSATDDGATAAGPRSDSGGGARTG